MCMYTYMLQAQQAQLHMYMYTLCVVSCMVTYFVGTLRSNVESLRHEVEQEHQSLFSPACEHTVIVSSSDDYQGHPPHNGNVHVEDGDCYGAHNHTCTCVTVTVGNIIVAHCVGLIVCETGSVSLNPQLISYTGARV